MRSHYLDSPEHFNKKTKSTLKMSPHDLVERQNNKQRQISIENKIKIIEMQDTINRSKCS